jgi:hypothetical protein
MGGRVDFSSTAENSTLDIGTIIMSKIKEKEALMASGRPSSAYLEPKIIQVYSQYVTMFRSTIFFLIFSYFFFFSLFILFIPSAYLLSS